MISKFKLKKRIKPPKYKHFARGSLLTRIRVGQSLQNQHSFTTGLADSPECACLFRSESSEQYFLDYFLYAPERQTLLSLVEHFVPNLSRLTNKNKLDFILRAANLGNDEFLPSNTILTIAVQKFILQTERFVKIEIEEKTENHLILFILFSSTAVYHLILFILFSFTAVYVYIF